MNLFLDICWNSPLTLIIFIDCFCPLSGTIFPWWTVAFNRRIILFICLLRKKRSVRFNFISDIFNSRSILYGLSEDFLLSTYNNLKKFKNRIWRWAFRKSFHSWFNKIEFLLQVIEANYRIDSIPIKHSVFDQFTWLEFAIDMLVKQNVENVLEHDAISEICGKLCNRP